MANGDSEGVDKTFYTTNFSDIHRRLTTNEQHLDKLDTSLRELEINVTFQKANLSSMDQRVGANGQRIGVLESQQRTLEKTIVSGDWFKEIDTRLRRVEDIESAGAVERRTQTTGRITLRDWLTFLIALIVCISTIYTALHVH